MCYLIWGIGEMKKLKSGITQMRKYLWSMAVLVMLFVVVLSPMQAKASSEELTPEVLGND